MTTIKTKIILGLILILSVSLRLFFLNQAPFGINADEAAFGYNAYSFLKTGSDEWGKLPIYIKSFGEYKLPGYFWVSLPFIQFFNLNITTIRLPSVIAGSLLPLTIFFIVKKLNQKDKIALLTAFSLSLLPTAVHFSRAAFESNLALFWLALAFLSWLNQKYKTSFLFLFLSFYTYNATRIILIPTILLLLLTNHQLKTKIYSIRKSLIITGLIYATFIISLLTNPHLMSRFKGLSFWQQSGFGLTQIERRNDHSSNNLAWVRLIHNRPTEFMKTLTTNYLNHFQFNYLFVNGDPVDRLTFPKSGLISFWQIPFFLMGFFIALYSIKKPANLFFFSLFLTAPFASATTFQTPSIIRSLLITLPLAYFIGIGLYFFFTLIKQHIKILHLPTLLLTLLFIFYFTAFNLHNYLSDYDHFLPNAFQSGYKEMVTKLSTYESQYSKIIITKAYGQPYIFILFFKKYPPAKYHKLQKQVTNPDKFGFLTVNQFDKYYFVDQINWQSDCTSNTLCIGTTRELDPKNPKLKILDTIYHQNQQDIIFVFATKK